MASATFVLKEPKARTETLIYLIIREGGQRLKFSTGEKINPSKWDVKNNRVNPRAANITQSEKAINTQLARYSEAFDVVNSAAKVKGEPLNLEQAREYLNKEFTNRPQPKVETFLSFSRGLHQSSVHKLETRKGYFTTINQLHEFEQAKRKGKPLAFEDINLDFYDAFVKYCEGKGLALNTIGSHIKNIKVFADVAFQKQLHTNTAYRSKGFKVLAEDVENIYLTEDELQKIYEIDLAKNLKLDRVRDLFLVACRTGLRFSDLKNLTPDKIINSDGGELIQLHTQKTGQVVYIPLHGQTHTILHKYRYNLPRVMSNQKFNEYLKELALVAGIEGTVTRTKTQGGNRVETISPKHQLVTVHTARRTFATLAYKAGLPAQSIMKITGHTTEKSFQKYIKLTNREHAELMAKHEYFKPQLKIVS